MSAPSDWTLLARYLSGECSAAEQAEVEAAIAADPEKQHLIVSMRTVWDAPDPQSGNSDTDRLWSEIAGKAGIATASAATHNRGSERQHSWLPSLYTLRRYAVAAVLLITCSLSYDAARDASFFQSQDQPTEWVEMAVAKGARDERTLSDGTRIWLDAGSSLQYPAAFSGDERRVLLVGEAYFEVASSADKPFVVYANQAVIKVLGTKFNVRAWQLEERVSVAVVEGKVALGADPKTRHGVEIVKGQMSTLRQDGTPSAPRPADLERQLGWMQHKVSFDNVPLHEILYQLERWYEVQFVLDDNSLAAERLTIQIHAQPLNEVLELLAALTGLQYQQADGLVHLLTKR